MNVLLSEKKNGVLVLTMNRPQKHNALNTDLTQQLLDAITASEFDPEVRSVVLVGQSPSF